MKYSHAVSVAFTVEGPWKNLDEIPIKVLLDALTKRVSVLCIEKDKEAYDLYDTTEVDG